MGRTRTTMSATLSLIAGRTSKLAVSPRTPFAHESVNSLAARQMPATTWRRTNARSRAVSGGSLRCSKRAPVGSWPRATRSTARSATAHTDARSAAEIVSAARGRVGRTWRGDVGGKTGTLTAIGGGRTIGWRPQPAAANGTPNVTPSANAERFLRNAASLACRLTNRASAAGESGDPPATQHLHYLNSTPQPHTT